MAGNLLDFSGKNLTHEAILCICDHWCISPEITALDLSGNPLGPSGVAHVAQYLYMFPNLRTISLARTAMRTEGLKALMQSIRMVPNLEELDLMENNLDSLALFSLAQHMLRMEHLKVLNLSCNAFRDTYCDQEKFTITLVPDDVAIGFMKMFSLCSGRAPLLETLYIHQCHLIPQLLKALMGDLSIHIKVLDISGNNIDAETRRYVTQIAQERHMAGLVNDPEPA